MAQASAVLAAPLPTPSQEAWTQVLDLSCGLTVDLPVPGFKLANLVGLQSGSVVGTLSRLGRDLPLRVNGQLVAWCEFEVVGNRIAVRITELA